MIVNLLSCNVAYLLSDSFFNNSIYIVEKRKYIFLSKIKKFKIFFKNVMTLGKKYQLLAKTYNIMILVICASQPYKN